MKQILYSTAHSFPVAPKKICKESSISSFEHYLAMAGRTSAQKAAPMLHAVTLIRSGIGRPHWQKRTLKALHLTKMHKTVIHKNTPSVNGMLASVKELIKVQPVVFRTDVEHSPTGDKFFLDNAEFFVDEKEWAKIEQ